MLAQRVGAQQGAVMQKSAMQNFCLQAPRCLTAGRPITQCQIPPTVPSLRAFTTTPHVLDRAKKRRNILKWIERSQRPQGIQPDEDRAKGPWWHALVGRQMSPIQINGEDIEKQAITPVTWEDGELVCSYNWIDRNTPAVYAPGAVPRWTPHSLPAKLPRIRDETPVFIDQDGGRVPESPFEPVFRVLDLQRERERERQRQQQQEEPQQEEQQQEQEEDSWPFSPTRWEDIDVLVNRNTLSRLFELSRTGTTEFTLLRAFFVGTNTLVVERREPRSWTHLSRDDAEFSTGVKMTRLPHHVVDSTGHHRVLRYPLGGLNCAVKFEPDAACRSPGRKIDPLEDVVNEEYYDPGESDPLATPDYSGTVSRHTLNRFYLPTRRRIPVAVEPRGTKTPAAARLAALRVRDAGDPLLLSPVLPQMYFGRMTHLVAAQQADRTVVAVHHYDLTDRLRAWETDAENQAALRRVVGILHQLRHAARTARSKSIMALYDDSAIEPADGPSLQVYECDGTRGFLDEDIEERFWG